MKEKEQNSLEWLIASLILDGRMVTLKESFSWNL